MNDRDEIKVKVLREQLNRVIDNIYSSMENTLKKWVLVNMEMVISTCKSSL